MELSSPLTLEMLGEPFLLEKRIELLHAIKEHGSISKAAKAVPMSYKSAWEAVDTMNSLSPEPIVSKDGGGTTITAYGTQLLENYAVLKREHTRFLVRLSELTDIQSGTFKTIGRLAMQISARNQIQAEIVSIESHNVNAKIVLKLKSGQRLISVITQEAVEKLQLKKGQIVTAIFKSSVVVLLDSVTQQSDDNILGGIVSKIDRDEENIKVLVDIGKHDKIVSVMQRDTLKDMKLCEGSTIHIMIKNNDIMVGK